jgi:hypothetical protein
VLERLLRRDVPASAALDLLSAYIHGSNHVFTHVGRRRVDDDETLLVGQLGVGRSLVVSLGSASAVVNGNDDRRLSSKLGRYVNVHASAGRVVTKVLDLGELGRTTSERVARNGTQKGKDRSNERREMHLV